MKTRYYLSAALMASCLLFTGCNKSRGGQCKTSSTKEIAQQQKIKINIVVEPNNLDPRRARAMNDMNLVKMFMEGLTKLNKDDDPVLAQAESVDISDDQLTYTFHLRDSLWSNGEKVTSQDFAYAWKQVLSPEFPADNAHQLFVIKNAKEIKSGDLPLSFLGISCPDSRTLVVELEHPTPYFLKLAALPVFYPVNQQLDRKNPNWAFSQDTYVGNGPFKMEKWMHHDRIMAGKNPGYWDTKNVRLEQIEILMVSQETGIKMFENNQLDIEGSPFSSIPLDTLEHLKKKNLVNQQDGLGTYLIYTNTDKSLLSSSKLRKALALAIDRQELSTFVLHDSQKPTTSLVPTELGLSKDPYFADGDKKQALALFEEALQENNLTRDDFAQLKLTYTPSERSSRIAQTIQQQWSDNLGITIPLEVTVNSAFFSKLSDKNYDLALSQWMADYSDAINFLEVFASKTSKINATNWENADYQKTLLASTQETDAQKRLVLLKNAEKMIIDAMPAIPLWNMSYLFVKNKKVKNIQISRLGHIDFKEAYVEKI